MGLLEQHATIISAEPDGIKSVVRYPTETLSLRITVKTNPGLPAGDRLIAEAYTNLVDQANPNGDWVVHEMALEQTHAKIGSTSWRRPDATDNEKPAQNTYFVMLHPTSLGKFHVKLRIRLSSNSSSYLYFGGSESSQMKVKIVKPDETHEAWALGPIAVEIHPNVFVGNFLAACNAQQMGFTAVLNVAEELDVPLETFTAPLPAYKKIGLVDGIVNLISVENIKAAVRWLESYDSAKTLMHCRAGRGRSGSIAVAYKSKKMPMVAYEDILTQIWKAKPDITPHKGLEHTLRTIKWD